MYKLCELNILIHLNYTKYDFKNYNDADISQIQETVHVCSHWIELFAVKLFKEPFAFHKY